MVIIHGILVRGVGLPDRSSALISGHCKEQPGDLGQKCKAILGQGWAKDVPSLEVPIPALACGAKGVFVEARSVLTRPPRVAFCKIRAYRSQCSVKLIAQRDSPPILCQGCDILPSHIARKQGQS